MWGIAVILIVVLAAIILYQWISKRQRDKELSYITNKLQDILAQRTQEQIKVVTGDEQIRTLAGTVNEVLSENSRNQAGYIKSQESMKKMLSNISHDLKTPLTVVLGYLEMENLKDRSENVEMLNDKSESVEPLKHKSKNMELVYEKVQEVIQMMNEFFDLEKLEARDKEYPMERVNVAEVVRLCVINFYAQLQQVHAQVELQIPEENIWIESNQEALNRILNNLVSNAVKYGMDGRYLGIKLIEKEACIQIQIIDHGKGIPEKHQEEVFERLYTLEDSRSSEYRGSGLGLSITKELISMIHGTIVLHSIPYEKTTFTIELKK